MKQLIFLHQNLILIFIFRIHFLSYLSTSAEVLLKKLSDMKLCLDII